MDSVATQVEGAFSTAALGEHTKSRLHVFSAGWGFFIACDDVMKWFKRLHNFLQH